MSRPALAASRAVDVINFLTAHPSEAFTLSDIVSRVGINVASAHAILAVLTEAGYISRHPRHRTYTLGPSLVAVGHAALERHRVIDVARDEIRHVSSDLGVEMAVTAPAGSDIVFVARAGKPRPRGAPLHVGQRVPFVPPLGSVFVAWSDDDAVEAWLSRAAESTTTEELASWRSILGAVRAHGYSVAVEADARRGLGHALEKLAETPSAASVRGTVEDFIAELGHGEYQLHDIESSRSYDVSMIAAPVFDANGDVVLAVVAVGLPPALSAEQVLSYAERLRDAGVVITKQTQGQLPG